MEFRFLLWYFEVTVDHVAFAKHFAVGRKTTKQTKILLEAYYIMSFGHLVWEKSVAVICLFNTMNNPRPFSSSPPIPLVPSLQQQGDLFTSILNDEQWKSFS